jgi:hypothetical protein
MSGLTKADFYKKISNIVSPYFLKMGYQQTSTGFERKGEAGNIFLYEIDVARTKGVFSLHLTLNVINKKLMDRVNKILLLAMRDSEYPYPKNWSEQDIEGSIKDRTNGVKIFTVTDWRRFKPEAESLAEFNSRFSIWLKVFERLEQVDEWVEQLIESVNIADLWFKGVGADQWFVDNTLYPSLVLLKMRGADLEFEDRVRYVISKARLKKEAELFCKYLNLGVGLNQSE